MTKKLIVCYIIENDEDVFELSYNSIKDVADEIVIIDGNKEDSDITSRYWKYLINKNKVQKIDQCLKLQLYDNYHIKKCQYEHKDKGANGKQRNKYIRFCRKHFEGDWCLVLDADEVVDKPEQIKETIKQLEQNGIDCANIHMRHTVYNLGLEDSTVETHFVPTRLFKITENIGYDEAEHVTLKGINKLANVNSFCIWHLGYSREIFRLKKKYDNHLEKSNIHSAQYLEQWYNAHLFGQYPVKQVKYDEIPNIILDHFNVNKDYHYFKDRGVELKHAEMVRQWKEYFKPYYVIDLGCGRGPYLRYFEMFCGCEGVEISEWAIKNKICNTNIVQGDILDFPFMTIGHSADLITAIDILEHLKYDDLDKALDNIFEQGINNFLFSIPFKGDPNLDADPTHIIKEDKEWWLNKLEKHGFKIKETPQDWHFKEQIIIAEK